MHRNSIELNLFNFFEKQSKSFAYLNKQHVPGSVLSKDAKTVLGPNCLRPYMVAYSSDPKRA